MPTTDLVLFDMDGVLADTEPLHFEATNVVLSPFGVRIEPDQAIEFLGGTDRAMFRTLIERHQLDVTEDQCVARKKTEVIDLVARGLVPNAGVCELLLQLKMRSIPAVVASSSAALLVETIVRALGIERSFVGLFSGEMVTHSKPAPDLFLLAARDRGMDPSRCLVIEDSPNGIAAGKAAGMKVLAVRTPYTREADLSAADQVVESLLEFDLEELE